MAKNDIAPAFTLDDAWQELPSSDLPRYRYKPETCRKTNVEGFLIDVINLGATDEASFDPKVLEGEIVEEGNGKKKRDWELLVVLLTASCFVHDMQAEKPDDEEDYPLIEVPAGTEISVTLTSDLERSKGRFGTLRDFFPTPTHVYGIKIRFASKDKFKDKVSGEYRSIWRCDVATTREAVERPKALELVEGKANKLLAATNKKQPAKTASV